MVGLRAWEMSKSPEPEWPMMQMSLGKSMLYISASVPVPEMVFRIDMAMATFMSPSTAQAVCCLMSIEKAGMSMESSLPATPWAKPA